MHLLSEWQRKRTMISRKILNSEDKWMSCYNLMFFLERLELKGADILNLNDEAFSIYSFIERLDNK